MNLNRPIILCGFTSCGKTTIGTMLAEKLSLPFYDTDALLTEQAGMTIQEIFAKGGEPLFRDMEHEIAVQMCSIGPAVVSTGGGMLTFERNARPLSESGIILYIDRPFDDCYRNLSAQPDRPLFKNHTREELYETYTARAGKYKKYACRSIKNDSTPEDAVDEVCRLIESLNL